MTSPHDEAFGAAILAIGKSHGIPEKKLEHAVKLARYSFESTAWNEAIEAGVPAEELAAMRWLIYGQ